MPDPDPLEFDTPHGPARVHVRPADDAVGALVLGNGAGGLGHRSGPGRGHRDRRCRADLGLRWSSSPIGSPGGGRPLHARQLDASWVAVVDQLRAGPLHGLDVVTGGRSSGARVACRTATAIGARGVLCLAFPLQPPRRRTATADPPTAWTA